MSFLELFNTLYNSGNDDGNGTSDTVVCESKLPDEEFHLWLMLPSAIMIFLLAMTMSRKNMWLGCFGGRPGAVFPMDILGKSNRVSFAAAWGAIAYLAADIVFDQKFAIRLEGKAYVTVFNGVLSMIIYGVDYFPLFAGLAMNSLTGYMIGTAYAWMLLGVSIFKQTECDLIYQARLLYILRQIPVWICLGYLSISLPIRMVLAFRQKTAELLSSFERISYLNMSKETTSSPEAEHVRRLLKPRPPPPPPEEGIVAKVVAIVKGLARDWIYHRHKNFRYSSRIISVMLMGVFLIYKTTLELMVFVLSLFTLGENIFFTYVEPLGFVAEVGEDPALTEARDTLFTVYYIFISARTCFIVSLSVACAIGLINILHMLSSYRSNMLDLYKGDNTHIPHRSTRSDASLLVGCMRYAGYQVGYIAWGFFIHFIILFIVSIALAAIIILIKEGEYQWILDLLLSSWPVLLMTVIITVGQLLMAKFFFLQTGALAIDNRRFLFVVSFFFFFYNIFLGLLSCLLRIIKSIVIGAIFLSRLDNSALPRRFQMLDPGFAAYVGFVQIECTHTHPVLVLFMRYLMMDNMANQQKEDKADGVIVDVEKAELKKMDKNVNKRARVRWNLVFTLFNNPSLRAQRKSYIRRTNELRDRIAKRYNIDISIASVLVENINNVEMSGSGADDENGGVKTAQMNWNALLGMGKFMRAIQKDMIDNEMTEGNPLAVFGHSNKAFSLASIDLTNADPKSAGSRWKRAAVTVSGNTERLQTNESHVMHDMNGVRMNDADDKTSTNL